MFKKLMGILAASLACLVMQCAPAATVLETTELVASTASADALLPQTIVFEVTTAGSYIVTLRDLNAPVLLQSLRAIVTHDLEVVAEVAVSYQNVTPPAVPAPATDTFSATPGTYRILVLGTVGAEEAGGLLGVSVAPAAGGSSILDQVVALEADAGPPSGEDVLQARFETQAAGTYQLTVTDHAFPDALVERDVLLLLQTSTGPVVVENVPGAFTASAGDIYDLAIFVTAGAQQAGLYSVQVSGGPSASIVYQQTAMVGAIPPAVDLSLPGAGTWSLTLTDLQFPESLTSFAAAVVQNAALLGSRSGGGTTNISAAEGAAQLFTFATSPSVGAYSVRLAQNAAVAHADVYTLDASPDLQSETIYSFVPPQPVSAGTYRLSLRDYRFPLQFADLRAAVVQGDSFVGGVAQADDLDVSLQAGAVKILVLALPPEGTVSVPGNGLFGLELATQPGAAVVLAGTQGVGGLFRSRPVVIPAAGPYDLTMADLEFPARLRTGALAVTRGTELIAQIFGGGTVPRQQLTEGTYVLNFLGQPASGESYGAYGLKVADSPPPPGLTLAANPAAVTSGQRTTLEWAATDATTCTAGGGWSGTKALSGTERSAALNADATFELTCTGPGGSITRSISVTVTPPTSGSSGSGGGGSIGASLLWMLLALLAAQVARRSGRRSSLRV